MRTGDVEDVERFASAQSADEVLGVNAVAHRRSARSALSSSDPDGIQLDRKVGATIHSVPNVPGGANVAGGSALVWYCMNSRCRKAIKVEPRYFKMTWSMCRCARPLLPSTSTKVWW